MSKYYSKIDKENKISTRSGTEIILPTTFNDLSSSLIRLCSYLQSQIQKTIYITHGSELREAKKSLANFPNPKARIEFLCSFPYSEKDHVISTVFDYSRKLFLELYDLRNVLAHEDWMTSEDFQDVVLFSKLSEQAKLNMASGKLLHEEDTTPRDTYDAIVRYIQSIKIVSVVDLHNALKDAEICAWILMQIGFVLEQSDPVKKLEMRRSFLVFKGTSHLFDENMASSGKVNVTSLKSKTIRG